MLLAIPALINFGDTRGGDKGLHVESCHKGGIYVQFFVTSYIPKMNQSEN